MEDPRELLLNRVRQNTNEVIIDYKDNWNRYILSSIIDGIFYTLADYIRYERKCEKGMGHLEIEYYCTDNFINTEDPRAYLEQYLDRANRVYGKLIPGTHRRMLLYFMNMLYFDL